MPGSGQVTTRSSWKNISMRILVLGAHPDDAEFFAGGFLAKRAATGATIRIVSVTNGQSGHQSIPEVELINIRRAEASRAGAVIGATYVTGDFPDGSLQPTLELRSFVVTEIRKFAPDLVLTHRLPSRSSSGRTSGSRCVLYGIGTESGTCNPSTDTRANRRIHERFVHASVSFSSGCCHGRVRLSG